MSEAEAKSPKPMKVSVRNFIDAAKLKTDLSFSINDLSDAMVSQASLFAYYGTIAAEASRQVDNLKMNLEVVESTVNRLIRDGLVKGGVKVTESMIDKSVQTNGRVVALKRALNEARQIESNAKTALEAFRHRRDMLVQMGLISREEMKGDLSIGRRTVVENENKAQRERVMDQMRAHKAASESA